MASGTKISRPKYRAAIAMPIVVAGGALRLIPVSASSRWLFASGIVRP